MCGTNMCGGGRGRGGKVVSPASSCCLANMCVCITQYWRHYTLPACKMPQLLQLPTFALRHKSALHFLLSPHADSHNVHNRRYSSDHSCLLHESVYFRNSIKGGGSFHQYVTSNPFFQLRNMADQEVPIWSIDSWRSKPIKQQPPYSEDVQDQLKSVIKEIHAVILGQL